MAEVWVMEVRTDDDEINLKCYLQTMKLMLNLQFKHSWHPWNMALSLIAFFFNSNLNVECLFLSGASETLLGQMQIGQMEIESTCSKKISTFTSYL